MKNENKSKCSPLNWSEKQPCVPLQSASDLVALSLNIEERVCLILPLRVLDHSTHYSWVVSGANRAKIPKPIYLKIDYYRSNLTDLKRWILGNMFSSTLIVHLGLHSLTQYVHSVSDFVALNPDIGELVASPLPRCLIFPLTVFDHRIRCSSSSVGAQIDPKSRYKFGLKIYDLRK